MLMWRLKRQSKLQKLPMLTTKALLDMVALEMAAPEPADFDEAPSEMQELEPPPAEPILAAEEPQPVAAPEPAAAQASLQPYARPPLLNLLLKPSLGSSLLASGILHRPKHAASDPLAPIRRMSQAEKIRVLLLILILKIS